ncbi:MAG: glycosyltransferase [bacterium]|nr:glycosyltransferase [bacterium]
MRRALHIVSGDLWGGAEAQAGLILSGLTGYSWQGAVLLFNDGVVADRYRKAEIECGVLKEKGGTLSLIRQALTTARTINPDIIVTHGYKEAFIGACLSFFLRRPLVTQHHGATELNRGFSACRMYCYQKLHRFISRFIASRVVTISHALSRQLDYDDVSGLCVIHNAASVPPVELATRDSQAGISLYIIGRLVPVKNVALAIDIIRSLTRNDVILNVVGDGPLENQLKDYAGEVRDSGKIAFRGYSSDIAGALSRADFLLITSISEGIPTVMLEALLLGVPVVSVELPGVKEIAEMLPAESIVFMRRDPVAAAEDLENYIAILPRLIEAAKLNREFSRRYFSSQRLAQEHCDLYDKVTGCR